MGGEGRRPRSLATATLAGALATVWPLALAAASGALGIPRNDDWVYARALFRTVQEGHLVLDEWTKAMLVGQIKLAEPLVRLVGERHAPLQALTAVLGGMGVAATVLVLRRFLPRSHTWVAVAALLLGPLWASLAASFMTDVPGLAMQTIGLALLLRSFERLAHGHGLAAGWWLGGLGAAFAAFSVREYAVAVPLAAAAAALSLGAHRRRRDLAVMLGGLLAWVGLAGALYAWRQGLAPAIEHGVAVLPPRVAVIVTSRTVLTLGLLAMPLLALGPMVLRRCRPAIRAVVAVVAVVAAGVPALVVLRRDAFPSPFLGNHLERSTSYPEASAHPTQHLPLPLWSLLVLLGVLATLSAAALLLVGLASPGPDVRRAGSAPTAERAALHLCAAYVVAVPLVSLAVAALTSGALFDRYLLPVVPFVVGLGLHRARALGLGGRAITRAAVAGLLPLAAYGVHQTSLTATHDAVRWRTGQELAARGFPAATVDAGYEWFSAHQSGMLGVARTPVAPGAGFWTGLFTPSRVCVVTAERGTSMGRARVGLPMHETRGRTVLGVEVVIESYRVPGSCPEVP